jgi:predicted Zn-dependent peptidase
MLYKKTTLKNGLRIITAPIGGTQTATVVVMVGVGSRYENEKEAGLSHFIEHMLFKGTEKRPNTLAISEELDSIGGEFNAFTGKDRTAYYAKVDAKHIQRAMDVISDMFLNSKLEVEEIEREKGTILQELNMYEDTPVRFVGDLFENTLYGNHPLGREIVGYKKTIASFSRKNFVNYMKKFYLAQDTVICVAGKFDEKKVLASLEKYFMAVGKGDKPVYKKISEKQSVPVVNIKFKKTDQTHFILGARAYDQNHKDRFALGLLSVILGGNMSSRLFIEVRERRGLAYSVHTDADTYDDCGYIATQAGVEHKNLGKTIEVIMDEYKKISENPVSAKELQNAKDFIRGKSVMSLEASDEVAMFFVDQEIKRKKIETIDDFFKKIDAVTAGDIQRVAKDVFVSKKMNLAIIGPHKNKNIFEKLLK